MNLTSETEVKNALVGEIHMLKTIYGYSAYELAVKLGFEGTLEEWIKSLKGEPGNIELFGEFDAKGKRIMNIADPEENGDAVNFKYINAIVDSFMQLLKKLPIENGGTGANNVTDARENLDVYSKKQINDNCMKSYKNINQQDYSTIDDIITAGFYKAIGIGDLPFGTCLLEVSNFAPYGIRQEARDYFNGERAVRHKNGTGGDWTEWEYENPPVRWTEKTGSIVYKTTERFNDKPVYTTVISIDNFEKNKTINLSGNEPGETEAYKSGIFGKVLRYEGYLYGEGHEYTKTLPYMYPSTENVDYAWLTFKNDENHSAYKIKMTMHGDNAPFDSEGRFTCNKGWVQIWFIKP